MVNNSTNLNKTNNHLSHSLTERKKTTAYDIVNLNEKYMKCRNID
jgi:hypothetical protein